MKIIERFYYKSSCNDTTVEFFSAHPLLAPYVSRRSFVERIIKTNPKEKEEIEANRFAVELVMGDPGMSFKPSYSYLSAQSLAEEAIRLGDKLKIDLGSIILNYSYFMNFYPVAGAALNLLYPNPDSIRKYRSHHTNLNLGELTYDNRRVFECLTQSEKA